MLQEEKALLHLESDSEANDLWDGTVAAPVTSHTVAASRPIKHAMHTEEIDAPCCIDAGSGHGIIDTSLMEIRAPESVASGLAEPAPGRVLLGAARPGGPTRHPPVSSTLALPLPQQTRTPEHDAAGGNNREPSPVLSGLVTKTRSSEKL